MILFGSRNSTSATTVKKDFLFKKNIKFNESSNFVTAEDYEFFLNIALNKGVFYYLHLPLGIHLFHEKSESAIPKKLYEAKFRVLKHHIFNNKNKNEANKNVLWKKVKKISEVKLSIFFFKKKPSFLLILKILYKIFKIPFYSLLYLIFNRKNNFTK